MMRVLTGDECGILKECLPYHKKEKITCLPTNASRRKGVISLAWTSKDQDCQTDQQFASLHLDSTVTLWERSNESKRSFAKYHSVREIQNIFTDCNISEINRPLGLAAIIGDRLVACNTFGQATVLKPLAPEPVVHQFTTVSSGSDSKHPPLSCMAVDTQSNKLALGGQDRETALFDIESSKQLFKCKNLPPDPQTLLAPLVGPSCIEFMGDNGNKFAVGTAHRQVRLYDSRAARRPVFYTPDDLLEYRVTALCYDATHHEHELFVGDAAGTLLKLDLRAIGRGTSTTNPVRYVGPGGSVRGLEVRENKLVVVGLDRMLRVYNVMTTKEEEGIYLKQRMNCVLLGREPWDTEEADADDGDIDQEDIVRDYVDSDQEEEDDDDDDGTDDDEVDSSGEEPSDDDDHHHHTDTNEPDDGKEGKELNDIDASSNEDDSVSEDLQESSTSSDISEEAVAVPDEKPRAPPARKRQKR
jgi:hypothetical protein